MTNALKKLLDSAAFKFFRDKVKYIDDEQAENMFNENRTLTAEAFKNGGAWMAQHAHLIPEVALVVRALKLFKAEGYPYEDEVDFALSTFDSALGGEK